MIDTIASLRKAVFNVFLLRMRLAGQVARMGEKRNAYRLLVRKPEGKSH
jgi:hypothetical protein